MAKTNGTRGKRVAGKKKPKSIKAKVNSRIGSKRKLSRMGKEMKKGQKGIVANYLTRSQVLRRLQVTLRDFRKLCILKGIYPRDPRKKASGKDKAYYHIKDVSYLAHEPLLNKFRELKAFMKKVRKAINRNELDVARQREANKPMYTLDHLVRERYPRFGDAIGDLDDAICLIHLFAALPADKCVSPEKTEMCRRLSLEWQYYVARSHSLSKVFVSIKGIYFQADVQGQPVTWVIPHQFTQYVPDDVDFRIMMTFLEFYEVLLKFVLFKLYHQMDMTYPPVMDSKLDSFGSYVEAVRAVPLASAEQSGSTAEGGEMQEEAPQGEGDAPKSKKAQKEEEKERKKAMKGLEEKLAEMAGYESEEEEEDALPEGVLGESLGKAMDDVMEGPDAEVFEQERKEASKRALLRGLKFYLNREVPVSWMQLVILSFGGAVGWEGQGSPFSEGDKTITHQFVDRPALRGDRHAGREYVQPQWVLDSINARMLLPTDLYGIGAALPPHLSPFVDDDKEGYLPAYREQLDLLRGGKQASAAEANKEEEEMQTDDKQEEDDDEEDEEDDEEEEEVEDAAAAEEEEEAKPPVKEPAGGSKKRKKGDEAAEASEEKELAKVMMRRKDQRLYRIMKQKKDKQAAKVQTLQTKRQKLEGGGKKK